MERPFSRPEILLSCLGLMLTFKTSSCYLLCDTFPRPSSCLHCAPTALCTGLMIGSSCEHSVHLSQNTEKCGVTFFAFKKFLILFPPLYFIMKLLQAYKKWGGGYKKYLYIHYLLHSIINILLYLSYLSICICLF